MNGREDEYEIVEEVGGVRESKMNEYRIYLLNNEGLATLEIERN